MSEGFSEFHSSEESEKVVMPSVSSADEVKSDEEHHLLPQEGSIATGVDTDTYIEQLEDTSENLEHGRLVHTRYSTGNPVSDENNRKLLVPKCDDELVGHVAASSHRAYQEIIDAQQEKVQYLEAKVRHLELELGRRSFLEDKQKRYEKAFLSSRTHANEQSKSCSASGASYDFTGMDQKSGPLQDSGFLLQQRLLEISNSLSDVELRQMKFLAKPRVDAFRLAKIREGFELFEELDANGVLSCTYVRELLEGIQRFDLLKKLDAPLLGNAESADGALYMDEDSVQGPRASYMESMMNYIEADRIRPHAVDDEVASGPDEHNRLSFPLLMRQEERCCAVGGSTFEESLNGTTGPDCTQNSDHLPNTSIGNMAHSAAGPYSAGRSNGALNGVLSETESTSAHLDAPGDASSACNSVDPAGHQVAVVSEPCRTDSANSRDSMSDRNTDCNGINAFAASGERQIEEEQRREARVRAWNSNRFLGQAEDCIIEALDSTSNTVRTRARREAVIRALTEEMRRMCSLGSISYHAHTVSIPSALSA